MRYFKIMPPEDDRMIGVQDENKVCYFNNKGRAIKVKGKKYYV